MVASPSDVAPLISVGSAATEMPTGLLQAPGGFAWWYVDLLDAAGNGLVLIWSFGLPFLPGYAAAARAGRAPAAGQRPSLNVAVYLDGRTEFYLLQEFAAAQVEWRPEEGYWRLGDSVFESERQGGRQRLRVQLDCPVPGSSQRLRGTMLVDGPARRDMAARQDAATTDAPTIDAAASDAAPPGAATGARGRDGVMVATAAQIAALSPGLQAKPAELRAALHEHHWTPLVGPAHGEASLRWGRQGVLEMRGRAYFDRNGSARPLQALGIDHWIWARAPFVDHERIGYLLWPERDASSPLAVELPPVAVGLEIDADGATTLHEDLRVVLRQPQRARYGMPWWRHCELYRDGKLWLRLQKQRPVDDGPFYLRSFAEAELLSGERVLGVSELCRPARVDVDWLRPFVRMRVQQLEGPNSPWLPLLSGPRQGRWRRLLPHLREAELRRWWW